jgi:tetratricopeptide (TPR) repeat protein
LESAYRFRSDWAPNIMSGEFGLAGYRFQYHVVVLTALELWCGSDDQGVESIVVEGRPGAEKVDYELVGRVSTDDKVVVQVKSRWGPKAWSPAELLGLLMSLERDASGSARLELVANGTFSSRAQQFIELLDQARNRTDEDLARTVQRLTTTRKPNAAMLEALRRSTVRIRPYGLSELREEVRSQLRRVRSAAGHGIGAQPAELLRAYLLGLAMNKSEADDIAGRTLHRREFLEAVGASRADLEAALAGRWGVPIRLVDREHAVRRDGLLQEVASHLTAEGGLHTADGRVRICVLTGPAGIGKTTLAQQYALDNAAEFDWIYQVTADGDAEATVTGDVLGEELEQFAAWLEGRGVTIRRGPHRSLADAAVAVAEALAGCSQSWLLIVDNAMAADTIASLLPASGYGAVLITTRNSAWHSPHPIVAVGALTAEQGRALIQRRLAEPDLSDSDVDALCGALDGFALSLVTATSYLRSTRESIGEFLAILSDEVRRLDALNFPLQRLDDYPRTAVAAVNLALQRLRAREGELPGDAIAVLGRASVVHPDRIPARLLASNRSTFNASVAALAELSLIDRWQDSAERDWVRVHRVVQDVVRAELGTHPDELRNTLLAVELAVTDLMVDCIEALDMGTGAALRLHAITLAERLRECGEQSWQTTTAMLSNAASIANIQGDLADAQRLVKQALELIPPGDYDPHIAGRRGRTLANLANLQLADSEVEAARVTLEAARRVHEMHRLIPAHFEALVECMAVRCRVEAYLASDLDEARAQFEKAKSLPEPTHQAALVRASCLVVIAQEVIWRGGVCAEFQDCAEQLLALTGHRDHGEPGVAAMAHMALAEAHGQAGAIDAAWRHFRQFKQIVSVTPGIDPGFEVDESIELALGLAGVCIDKMTGFPYRDINRLVEMLLADIDGQVAVVDWALTQRDWIGIRVSTLKAMHAAQNGHVGEYRQHAREAKGLVRRYRKKLPGSLEAMARKVRLAAPLAELQNTRRQGLNPGESLSNSLSAPVRPQYKPERCRHFDLLPTRSVPPDAEEPDVEVNGDGTQLVVDWVHATTTHAALLGELIGDHVPLAQEIEDALQKPAGKAQDFVDHLMGAWRVIDTVSYKLGDVTGESIDEIRNRYNGGLIRSHQDEMVDTVPTRGILHCLNNGWYPELNQILTQLDQEGTARMLADLVGVEYRLATELAGLTGASVAEVVDQTRDLATAFDSTVLHPGGNSYDVASGTIGIGRAITGSAVRIWLNDPEADTVDHVWIFGDGGTGKSNSLRVVLLEAVGSGWFCVFPSDPRNEHGFDRLWDKAVETPAWIATNVADTIRNLEAAVRIVKSRAASENVLSPSAERPGIVFGIDDAEDVLRLPRGRELIHFILTHGPTAGVGIVAVIGDLDCIDGDEVMCRAIADARNTLFAGRFESDRLKELRSAYPSRKQHE